MGVRDTIRAAFAVPAPYDPSPFAQQLSSPWTTTELETLTYAELYPDSPYLPVSRAMVQTLPAYARGRDLICGTLARLTLQAVDSDGVVKTNLDGSQTNSAAFAAQPDPAFSRFVTVMWSVDDLIHYGVCWWLVTSRYSLDNRPRSITRVLPGSLAFHDGGLVTVNNVEVDPGDLIRIDGPHEGILVRAAHSVRNALALEYASAKFANSPVPLIELHQTDGQLAPTEIQALIQSFANARSGPNGLVAYTPSNISIITHGEAIPDLLVQGRNQQSVDAARFLGLPADVLDANAGFSMTYSNVSQKAQAAVDFGLANYSAALEARLSMPDITPAGTFIKFRYDELTAASDSNPDTPAPEPEAPVVAPSDSEGV